jgi:PAS domain S-box-containing protein
MTASSTRRPSNTATPRSGGRGARSKLAAAAEFFDFSPDLQCTANAEGYFELVNASWPRILGYTQEELLSRPFVDFIHPRDIEKTIAMTAQLAKGSDAVEFENRYRAKDGTYRWLSWNAKTVDGLFYCVARDVTELKQEAAEVERLAAAAESATDAILTKDLKRRITSWNAGAELLYGYSASEIIGHPVDLLVPPEKRGEAQAVVDRVLAGERIPPFDTQRVSKDGSLIDISLAMAPIRDTDGDVVGASSLARDISEDVAIRQSLADQQAYNRGLIEASVDGLVTIDRALRITDVNETMCRMIAREREELVGSIFSDHFLESERAMAGVRRTFREGKVADYELTLQSADSRLLPVSFNAGVYLTAAGQAEGILAAARDVSAQKALQQRLFEGQYYTRSLIEASIDPMMTTDAGGIITDVNRQMELLTGHTRQQLIGSPFRDYVTEPERADRGIERTLSEGSVSNFELTARALDGTQTVVSYNATTYADRDGVALGVFATARDVTDFKALEHELRDLSNQLERRVEERTHELAVANKELEAFSYSVSHDLRAPLRAIDGFSNALSTHYADQLDEPAQRMLERVRAGTAKMGELIDSMLVLSRLSRRELKLERVDLTTMAREIARELEDQAPEREVELTIEDGLEAVADAEFAHTALLNLIGNAWKFTAGVEHARIELSRANGDGGGFVLRDNGAGFDMAYAHKLFAPFERLHRDDEFPGTGIGLATVERIVRRHGGTLRGEGWVGEGAAFHFDFGAKSPKQTKEST